MKAPPRLAIRWGRSGTFGLTKRVLDQPVFGRFGQHGDPHVAHVRRSPPVRQHQRAGKQDQHNDAREFRAHAAIYSM